MHSLTQLRTAVLEFGYARFTPFLPAADLDRIEADLWLNYPKPDQFFARPESYRHFVTHQYAGVRPFPFHGFAINSLALHPRILDVAEHYLDTTDVRLYNAELWAKYGGFIDYAQRPHRDYPNHTLVVPCENENRYRQLSVCVLLSDVATHDGPTRIVPLHHSRQIDFVPAELSHSSFENVEATMVGPRGSGFLLRPDVLHRASNLEPGRARFVLFADFQAADHPPWMGKMAWPNRSQLRDFVELIEGISPRQRNALGFPPPGDSYWTPDTVRAVSMRYPRMDMSPYKASS